MSNMLMEYIVTTERKKTMDRATMMKLLLCYYSRYSPHPAMPLAAAQTKAAGEPSTEAKTRARRPFWLNLFAVSLAIGMLLIGTAADGMVAAASNEASAQGPGTQGTAYAMQVSGAWSQPDKAFYAKLNYRNDNVAPGKLAHGQAALIRGGWSRDHLVMIINYSPDSDRTCNREIFVARDNGKANEVVGEWIGNHAADRFVLTSSVTGAEQTEYPYARELKACGDLILYGLSPDPGSPSLRAADREILASLADLLRRDISITLRIIGHTASTGNADKDHALSIDRAKALKKELVESFRVEGKRLVAEGAGSAEPIADVNSEGGQAVNDRIEIVAEKACQRAKEEQPVVDICGGIKLYSSYIP